MKYSIAVAILFALVKFDVEANSASNEMMAEGACEICLTALRGVQKDVTDVSTLTPAQLLQYALDACNNSTLSEKAKTLCKGYALNKNQVILDYIRKEGKVRPEYVCFHIELCPPPK